MEELKAIVPGWGQGKEVVKAEDTGMCYFGLKNVLKRSLARATTWMDLEDRS